MTTKSTDTIPEILATPLKTCSLCNQTLKHGAVTMLGKNREDQDIVIHPECMTKNSNIKVLSNIHVHLDEGKKVSSAKKLVIQKRLKALYKAIAIANAKQEQKQ